MPKVTTNDNALKEKLKYLNLDLEKIPEILTEYRELDYRISNIGEEKDGVVYKNIPIDKIQILLTPNPKNENMRKKYSEAIPLYKFLNLNGNEEDIERYTIFLGILNNVQIEDIEEIEKQQEQFQDNIPFRIKYEKSFLWQIYYSQVTDTYFMLVSINDLEYSHMFYLLKKQIEFSKSKKKNVSTIYVPISRLEYSRKILDKSEIRDIENYLWIFTGEWVTSYEVYDKENNVTLQIVGKAKVYNNVETEYKIKLRTKEEAQMFYKQIKALFILKTELSQYYKFEIMINKKSELEFYFENKNLIYSNLPDFIKNEYVKVENELVIKQDYINRLKDILNEMKIICFDREKEYLEKEKVISTFLECKKSFFGKIKFFFKSKKSNNKPIQQEDIAENKNEVKVKDDALFVFSSDEKDKFTIEDLVMIYAKYDILIKDIKNLQLDIEALELKTKNLERKIRNSQLYIDEIENHKKSIFEFWRFANKDELPSLTEGGPTISMKNNIKKTFSFDLDFEDLGNKVDKMQRAELTKNEINATFLASTELLDALNFIKNIEGKRKEIIDNIFENLKEELNTEIIGNIDFDIFGNMTEESTKVKTIANKHHREIEKNKLNILDINKDTTKEEFLEIIERKRKIINEAMEKITVPIEMDLYRVVKGNTLLDIDELCLYDMNPINCFEEQKNSKETDVNLYKITIKENMHALFLSNIIFYDNSNDTLPVGMNLSTKVLIDTNMFEFALRDRREFKTNLYSSNDEDASELKVKNVTVYEYELKRK